MVDEPGNNLFCIGLVLRFQGYMPNIKYHSIVLLKSHTWVMTWVCMVVSPKSCSSETYRYSVDIPKRSRRESNLLGGRRAEIVGASMRHRYPTL